MTMRTQTAHTKALPRTALCRFRGVPALQPSCLAGTVGEHLRKCSTGAALCPGEALALSRVVVYPDFLARLVESAPAAQANAESATLTTCSLICLDAHDFG